MRGLLVINFGVMACLIIATVLFFNDLPLYGFQQVTEWLQSN